MGDISEHFDRSEFACKCGCGFAAVDVSILSLLKATRIFGKAPVIITSGCRCEKHNVAVGGSKNSMHTKGMAVDFRVVGLPTQDVVADWLEEMFPNSHGIGRYNGRTHFDVRPAKARWDKR